MFSVASAPCTLDSFNTAGGIKGEAAETSWLAAFEKMESASMFIVVIPFRSVRRNSSSCNANEVERRLKAQEWRVQL